MRNSPPNNGALPPSWSAGLAFPRDRAVYPVTAHAELTPLLRHELVHIALADAQIPLWINEELAVTFGDGLSLERCGRSMKPRRIDSTLLVNRRFPEHGHREGRGQLKQDTSSASSRGWGRDAPKLGSTR